MPNNGYDYSAQQEQIRKAKGNPNKNVHSKKNNSNYQTAKPVPVKTHSSVKKGPNLPRNLKITLVSAFLIIVVLVILTYFVFPGVEALTYGVSLFSGMICLFLYTKRQYFTKDGAGTLSKILWIIILVLGLFYTCLGGYMFITYFIK